MTAALAIQQEPLDFTEEQLRLITDVICKGFTAEEAQFFTQVAKTVKMNPLKRQIYAMKRWDGSLRRDVMQIMTSIEGLRAIASRSKTHDGKDCYAGSSRPEYTYDKEGKLMSAVVTVIRIVQDKEREFTAEAFYDESVQMAGVYEGQGQNKRKVGERPNSMWEKRPRGQLAKCAEALALRKAFPEETGGLYIDEEGPSDETHKPQPEERQPIKPEAEGMQMEAETETVPPRHWSDLLIEDAYKLVTFTSGKWAGMALWEIQKAGQFEDAFKQVPRDLAAGDSVERLALDALYFTKLRTRWQKKGYDEDEVNAALRKGGFLKPSDTPPTLEMRDIPGELLMELGTQITDLPELAK
jgi:phage recombination protein Bet